MPRIGGIFEERAKRIEGDFADAQRLKADSEAALAAYEKSLADARNRAQAIGAEIRDKLNAEAEERRKALEAKLNAQLAEAEKTDRRDEIGRHGERARHRGRRRGAPSSSG